MNAPRPHLHLERILFPTDLSEASLSVFSCAADLARLRGGEITVLYLVDRCAAGVDRPLPLTSARLIEASLVHQAERRLEAHADLFRHEEVPYRTEVRLTDSLPDEIRRVAEMEHFDLIVMGTHGRTGLTRLVCGSVAEETVRHTSCPVLMVHVM